VPVGGPPGQANYLNAVAELQTRLAARKLLASLQGIERQLGRRRSGRCEPRTIDLDLLLYGRERHAEPGFTVPHPAMHYRAFVLRPLAEIAPEAEHPDGWTAGQRWGQLQRRPRYLALTGPLGAGKSTVARKLAERLGAEFAQEWFDQHAVGRFYRGQDEKIDDIHRALLRHRSSVLARRRFPPGGTEWVVSDFWFGQSLAYCAAFEPEQVEAHCRELLELAAQTIEPTLVAAADELLRRISDRGRECEAAVTVPMLQRLRDGFRYALQRSALAPPLYLVQATTVEETVSELAVVADAIASAD
jgi:2-amino-4-hydroxy-6-hydroxymethyldihydropteridine diphosphokinase